MNNMAAHEDIEMYPYAYIFENKRTILIWQISKAFPDSFKLGPKGSLISAETEQELKIKLGVEYEKVKWSDGSEIDFDKFWASLRNLRVGRASSPKTCSLLLDGWNFLEDLAQTFKLDQDLEGLRSPLLNKVYDKLLYGSNLPSITPEGKSYSPLWLEDEIYALRKGLKRIWKLIEHEMRVSEVSE